ncbi:MAG: EamA family transporter [Candidatus Aminicenantales bacterium]
MSPSNYKKAIILNVIGFSLICLIWGTTFLVIKIGLEDLPPFLAVGLRFLMAGLVLSFYLLLAQDRVALPKGRENLKFIISLTLLNYLVPYALVYWGEQFISSGLTSVIFATLPLNIIFISTVLFRDKPSLWDVGGVVLGLAGIVVIFSEAVFHHSGFHIQGMIAVYLCSLSQAAIAIILKRSRIPYQPLEVNLVPFLASGVLITGLSLVSEQGRDVQITWSAVLSVIYLSVFGTVLAFGIYLWLIPRIKLSLLSTYTYILPLIALLVGYLFLNETLSPLQLGGTCLVLGGITLTSRRKV